jgi:hypothetical protein
MGAWMYNRDAMRSIPFLIALGALILAPAPANAGAGSFVLVNGTNDQLSDLAIRRFGTEEWKALGVARAAGARGPIDFDDPDCAFDIRARVGGGQMAVWSGVNLCETKSVTLRRSDSGATWVDYD